MESNDACRLDTSTSGLTSSFLNTANTDMPFLLKKKKKKKSTRLRDQRGCRGRDRMVAGFTTTCVISQCLLLKL